jgi:hypothetical protein
VKNNFYIVLPNQTEMNNLLSAISYQLSAISYQLSAISYQPSAITAESFCVVGVILESFLKISLLFPASEDQNKTKSSVYKAAQFKQPTKIILQSGVHPP